MARGPGALGDLPEGLGAAARRHGGVALSRAWVDRFWAALGDSGCRGGAATFRGRWASGDVLVPPRVFSGFASRARDP